MKRLAAAFIVATLAAAPGIAGAQSDSGSQPAPDTEGPSATDRLQEGAAAIVEGLRMFMDQLQSYQPPEVLPNGDIIIRRRPPQDGEPPSKPETPEGKDDKSLKL